MVVEPVPRIERGLPLYESGTTNQPSLHRQDREPQDGIEPSPYAYRAYALTTSASGAREQGDGVVPLVFGTAAVTSRARAAVLVPSPENSCQRLQARAPAHTVRGG